MKTLVVANLASGVGRSTVAASLVRYLIHRGQRVLAVDLDEQGSLGDTLRHSRQASFAALRVDALLGQDLPHVPARAAVVIDGAEALRGLAHQPRRLDHFIENLQDLVATLDRRFDACVIDTAAHPGIGLLAGLACADAQALWEMSDPVARQVWRSIEPSIAAVAARLTAAEVPA